MREILILMSCLNLSFGGLYKLTSVKTEPDFERVLSKWENMEYKMKTAIGDMVKHIMPNMIRQSKKLDLSFECQASLLKVIVGLTQGKLWAFQMLDATAKPPSGVTLGNFASYGNYDLCLNITVPSKSPFESEKNQFRGQYCIMDFRPALPKKPKVPLAFGRIIEPFDNFNESLEFMGNVKEIVPLFYTVAFRLGVCVPSTCSQADVNNIARTFGDMISVNGNAFSCETLRPLTFDSVQIGIIAVILFFIGLSFVATVYEYLYLGVTKNKSLFWDVLNCFYINRNVKKLVNTDIHPNELRFIHGLKFMSLCWIVLGHTHLSTDFNLIRNGSTYKTATEEFGFQLVMNATLSVQTFFLIAGLLFSYNVIVKVDNFKFNVPLIIFSRIYRILPTTMLVVGLATLTPLVGSGPIWLDNIDHVANTCRNRWWAPLLFVNNFQPLYEMCLPTTWFLSVDMQLFVVAVAVLALYLKNNNYGVILAISLLLTSIFLTGFMTYFKNLDPALLATTFDQEDLMTQSFYQTLLPYNNLGVYMIGLLCGIILTKKELILPKSALLIGWLTFTTIALSVIFGTLPWNRGEKVNLISGISYASLSRNVWALAIGWIIVTCAFGYSGIINDVLSWKAWVPLSRLTFLVYLLHYPIMFIYTSSARDPLSCDHKTMVWRFFGHLCVSVAISSFVYVLFEAPLMSVFRLFISKYLLLTKTREKNHKSKQIPPIIITDELIEFNPPKID